MSAPLTKILVNSNVDKTHLTLDRGYNGVGVRDKALFISLSLLVKPVSFEVHLVDYAILEC